MARQRKIDDSPLRDVAGNRIAGYRYGPYWLGVSKGVISGLCGGSFRTENDLVRAYDAANGCDRADGPGLIRCYSEGAEFILRRGGNNHAEVM